jgi:hypothetical protein
MKTVARWLACLCLACTLSGTVAGQVFAQPPTEAAAEEDMATKWPVAYLIVGLGIVLGLINVCRPGKRKGDTVKLAS